MPLISVIIPVYMVEPWLKRCVDSLLRQTMEDYELILVDDGSPDTCGQICDEYAQEHPNITALHKNNGGLSDARNAGIDWVLANSGSEWLTFVDGDDWVHPRYLERLYDAAVATNSAVSIGAYIRTCDACSDFPDTFSQVLACSPESFFCEHNGNIISAWGSLYRKELWRDIRFPVGRICEDLFTMHRVIFSQERISSVPDVLYFYFQRPDSIMKSQWSPAMLDELDAHIAALTFFQENGFSDSFQKMANRYLWAIAGQIRKVSGSLQYRDAYAGMLEKRLRKETRRLRQKVDISPASLYLYSIDYANASLRNRLHFLIYYIACFGLKGIRRQIDKRLKKTV